jgi:pimeloyl-ACP methyl ester carboxylesterase
MKNFILNFFVCFILSFYLISLFNNKVFGTSNVRKELLNIKFPETFTEAFQTHIIKTQEEFKGVFSIKSLQNNKYSLGYASSRDGKNWNIEKEILSLDKNLFAPRIFFFQSNNVKIFFTKEDNPYKIYKVECDENFNYCQNTINLVLEPLPNNFSENKGVFSAFLYYENDIYYLFYGAWGDDGFKIKLAFSSDLNNWMRCSEPIIRNADGPFFYKKYNKYQLFFHSSDSTGIKSIETSDSLSCNMNWKPSNVIIEPSEEFDKNHLVAPTVIDNSPNLILIYYTGLGTDNVWRPILAYNTLNQRKTPIILLPGLMGSWNKEAILHNQSVGVFDWKLLPFVKEYDGIINTLKNLGYQENQDFFVFPYDWRKSVEDSSEDLKTFINAKIPQDKKVNLIGHSLGGLVARIFTQKNKEKVNKIISVGSPHEGAVQVYKPLEAGEIDRENNFFWLAQKIVLILNKSNLEPDRETIRKKFPVAFDLFPTFNFLKNKDGEEIPINTLSLKNNLLIQYNSNFSEIFPQFIAIYGEKDNKTPSGYIVDIPDLFNKILKNYQDGQPISSYFDYGDYTVLSKSANKDYDSEKLQLDHGEIITEKESIKKIFEKLEIFAENNQILPGKKTVISPSLIFFIKSPIETFLHLPDNSIITDFEGIIFVENAQYGDYLLEIKGKEKGRYTIIAGQINNGNDLWEVKEGEVTADQPETQKEYYSFNFNQEKLNYIFPTTTITLSPTPTLLPTILITSSFSPTPFPSINSSSQQNNNSSQNNSNFSSDVSNINNQQSNLAQNTNLNKNQILGRKTSINNLTSADVLGVKNENNFVKRENNKLPKKTKNPSNKFFIISLLILGIVTLTYQIINKKISNLNRIKDFLKKLIKSKLSKIKLLKKIKYSIFNTIVKR